MDIRDLVSLRLPGLRFTPAFRLPARQYAPAFASLISLRSGAIVCPPAPALGYTLHKRRSPRLPFYTVKPGLTTPVASRGCPPAAAPGGPPGIGGGLPPASRRGGPRAFASLQRSRVLRSAPSNRSKPRRFAPRSPSSYFAGLAPARATRYRARTFQSWLR